MQTRGEKFIIRKNGSNIYEGFDYKPLIPFIIRIILY